MPIANIGNQPPAWLSLGLASACVIALADWPYGFYQLLRLAITIYSAWIAWRSFETSRTKWAWAFLVLAVLYNPFLKIALDKSTWSVVNLLTAATLVFEWWERRHRLPK